MPRSFRHQACGGTTLMPTTVLATILRDPSLVGNRTHCTHCGKTVPFAECVWVETGEDLQSYFDGIRYSKVDDWTDTLEWPEETEDTAGS